jgi:hypothetical protein
VDLREAVVRVRSSYTGGTLGTPKNRERRDVDLISDVIELLERWRGANHDGSSNDLVFPGENGCRYLSATVLLRRHLYPAMTARPPSAGSALRTRSEPSTLSTHVRETCSRARRPNYLALAPSRPFLTQGHNRHLRPWERAERKLQAAKMEGAFPV